MITKVRNTARSETHTNACTNKINSAIQGTHIHINPLK